jgi:hypothetical protein
MSTVKVRLICHGMMLFWFRKAGERNLNYDGYTILIPQAPLPHPGDPGHELRLGAGPRASLSVLGYDVHPRPTQEFVLDFGFAPSPKQRGPKCHLYNLVLYRNLGAAAYPDYDAANSAAGVAFAIDIPYPWTEDPLRAMEYDRPPYIATGTTAMAFDIHPKRVTGTTMFTFEIEDPSRPIALLNKNDARDRRPIPPGSSNIGADINVHLYSQPPHMTTPGTMPHHFQVFQRLLRFHDAPLDLTPDPNRKAKAIPIPTPDGLTDEDTQDLAHLLTMSSGTEMIMIDDPAECGQGGGC